MNNAAEDLAAVVKEADDRWQHGIGNSGTSWEKYIGYAILTSDTFTELLGAAWDDGFVTADNGGSEGNPYDT